MPQFVQEVKNRGTGILVASQHERSGRDRILHAARDLFAAHGFHQTPMAELASAAKVSVGQIYRLFKNKEEIIGAIVDNDAREREAVMMQLRERFDAGDIDIERTLTLLFLGVMDHPHEGLSFDILAEAFRNPNVGTAIAAMCARFRQLLGEFACIANPGLSGEALTAAEEVMLACMFGLGHRTLSGAKLSAEIAAGRAAHMIVAALRTMD